MRVTYDPERHQRRSMRLKGYDYTRVGAYFVTVCTRERECSLGQIEDRIVILSEYGQLVEGCWRNLPRHFPHVELDAFVVMPNHVHGVIWIVDRDGDGRGEDGRGEAFAHRSRRTLRCSPANASPLQPPRGTRSGSLGAIVQNLKSVTSRKINRMRATPGLPVWQRNYYERVIRDDDELQRIREYIRENPARWEEDENHPENIKLIG